MFDANECNELIAAIEDDIEAIERQQWKSSQDRDDCAKDLRDIIAIAKFVIYKQRATDLNVAYRGVTT